MLRFMTILAVLALAVLVLAPVANAAREKAEKADVQEGTFVKSDGKTITIKDSKDKEQTFDLAKDVKISCNDKACTIDDLKKDNKVKLTIANKMVTMVEASTK